MFKSRGSLLSQTAVVLGISAIAIVASALILNNAFVIQPLLERTSQAKAALIVLTTQTYFEIPADRRPEFELEMMLNHDILVSTVPTRLQGAEPEGRYYDLLRSALSEELKGPIRFIESDNYVWAEIPSLGTPAEYLQIAVVGDTPFLEQFVVGVVILVLSAIIVGLASYWIVARLARQLRRASSAAESFRGVGEFERLELQGPRELASLAASFNNMAQEITELIANRTTILVGVSHDVGTPLTRMRILLELLSDGVDPELLAKLRNNLAEIEDLMSNTVELGLSAQEDPVTTTLKPFVHSILNSFEPPVRYTWRGAEDLRLQIARRAFERIVNNLVSNGLQHAREVHAAIEVSDVEVVIHVKDLGPGIPPDQRDRVLQPFYRIDPSRSSTTGGSGLGLAIVNQLCIAHHWRIAISDNRPRGTDVAIHIPVTTAEAVEDTQRPATEQAAV